MDEYNEYAGKKLVEIGTEELCLRKNLPILLGVWIENCPELVAAQEKALSKVAGESTRRFNFGIFSVFWTEILSQDYLLTLQLPKYTVTTIAGAGHFLTVSVNTDRSTSE